MTIAYLVTEGQYSDYQIVAAFSTRELAEGYIDMYREGMWEPGIEEWVLDLEVPLMLDGKETYSVIMDEYGNCTSPPTTEILRPRAETLPSMVVRNNLLHLRVRAKSAEHATKIADECRFMLLAHGHWKDGRINLNNIPFTIKDQE